MKSGLCYYCDKDAQYFDVVTDNEKYLVSDVCENHLEMGLSS